MKPQMYAHENPEMAVIWACGNCGLLYPSGTARRLANLSDEKAKDAAHTSAERCCHCSVDGCTAPKERNYSLCESHRSDLRLAKEAAEAAAMAQWPIVQHGGPYYDRGSDQYAEDLDTLVDAYDANAEPFISPCSTRAVGCPDLAEYVEQAWYEEFGEDGQELSADLEAVLDAVQQIIAEHSPVAWIPRNERVALRWDSPYGWVAS